MSYAGNESFGDEDEIAEDAEDRRQSKAEWEADQEPMEEEA